MYLHNLPWQLSALALASQGSWLFGASASATKMDKGMTLKPIDVADFESAFGIQRRAVGDLSDLDLKTQEQLIFGRPAEQGQYLFANMTLYAPNGLQTVLMERFQGLTSAVDCNDDDGSMSLTFRSESAFQHALKTWDFINGSEEKIFLLIANHNGCGPDDERQPYLITNIREDAKRRTTYLTAQVAQWSEVAENWDLDLGQASTKISGSHYRRGRFGHHEHGTRHQGHHTGHHGHQTGQEEHDTSHHLHSIPDMLQGHYDKSRTFDVSVGAPGKQTNILDLSQFKLSCDNCFITGSFTLTAHISVKSSKIEELSLNASPKDLAATLTLGTTISDTKSPQQHPFNKEIFSAPTPDAGFIVPKLFKLGTTISYDIGGSLSFSGSASAQYGLSVKVPDSAQITADLHEPSHSSATGFDAGDVKPIFHVTDLSANGTMNAFSQPKLSFGVEIHDVANFEVDLAVKVPSVDVQLSGAYKQGGLCAPGSATTGVQLSSRIGTEVDVDIEAHVGSHEGSALPNFNRKFFSHSKPVASMCSPLQIPGLGPKSAKHTAPNKVALPIIGTGEPTTMRSVTSVRTATPIPTERVSSDQEAAPSASAMPAPVNGTAGYRPRVKVA